MRQVKLTHPIFALLKKRMEKHSRLILKDEAERKIKISKHIIQGEENSFIIVKMENGRTHKKYLFLTHKNVVRIEATSHLESCFKKNPKTYLDALELLIDEGREVSRE